METEISSAQKTFDEKGNTTICRICLKRCPEMFKSLFEKFKKLSLFDHINILTNIEIKLNDRVPDTICLTCYEELVTSVNFKEKCENSNNILKRANLESLLKYAVTYSEVIVVNEPDVNEESDDVNDDLSVEYPEVVSTRSESILDASVKEVSSTESTVQCHDCGTLFRSKCKLRVHWKKTHMLKSLICFICKKTFKSFKAFHTHRRAKKRSCTSLQSSLVTIEGIGNARLFLCKECPYKTKRIKDIQNHISTHSGERPFKCDYCSKKFTQLNTVQNHMEMVHKKYKIEITCQICGKVVKGRPTVYAHMKSHEKVQCPICKRILSRISLKQHMLRHGDSKRYTCDICASTFYTSSELYNHRRNHNKDNPSLKCPLCDYRSNRADSMKRHKNRHTDDNLPCTTCGMFFLTKQKLSMHERLHVEEKSRFCPYCNHSFHTDRAVRKHVSLKHKNIVPVNKKLVAVFKDEVPALDPYSPKIIEVETTPMEELF